MAIAFVQKVTGTGSLVITSVAAGNTLIVCHSALRNPQTQAVIATPTDSAGTLTGGIGGVPAKFVGGSYEIGVGVFFEANAASGSHTITPEACANNQVSVSEYSGMVTASLLDVSATAKFSDGTETSQVTGTTSTTAQNAELIIIAFALGHNVGVTNIGLTNPVSGFTTLHIANDSGADIGAMHAYKIVSVTGTQSATFNWTDSELGSEHAAIAAFKGVASSAPFPPFDQRPNLVSF